MNTYIALVFLALVFGTGCVTQNQSAVQPSATNGNTLPGFNESFPYNDNPALGSVPSGEAPNEMVPTDSTSVSTNDDPNAGAGEDEEFSDGLNEAIQEVADAGEA